MLDGTGPAKWFAPLMLAVAFLCAAGPIAQPQQADPRPTNARHALAFLIWYDSFQGPGGGPSGLIAAGWEDGLVVFALDANKPGVNLQTGRIQRAELDQVLTDLHDAGFFVAQAQPGLVPDNSYATMSARRAGETATHRWNETLSVPWGAHVGASQKFREFARMWAVSRTVFAFACPKDCTPLSKDPDAERRSQAVRNHNETIP